jgi:hypothetical protein
MCINLYGFFKCHLLIAHQPISLFSIYLELYKLLARVGARYGNVYIADQSGMYVLMKFLNKTSIL